MYAFIDRPIVDLCNGSRFMLWAMRAWRHAVEQRICPPRALASAFSHMSLLRMLPDFHMAMALLNRDGLFEIVLAPMPHIHVVEHEAVLLAVWRDATSGRQERSRGTLALMVDEESIAPLETAVSSAAAKLTAAGFDPPGLFDDVMKEMK